MQESFYDVEPALVFCGKHHILATNRFSYSFEVLKRKGDDMPNLATVKVKIEPQLKNEVETIFQTLGLTPVEAIKLFYRVVKLEKKLPFDLKTPNDETLQAIRDAEERKNLTECEDVKDFPGKLRA